MKDKISIEAYIYVYIYGQHASEIINKNLFFLLLLMISLTTLGFIFLRKNMKFLHTSWILRPWIKSKVGIISKYSKQIEWKNLIPNSFMFFLITNDIKWQLTTSYTPHQNNMEMTWSMLHSPKNLNNYWREVATTIIYLSLDISSNFLKH